ncbi:LacI family DNA-binding transcriptional regulator [Enterococcus sp. BWR-S5]|uniref:LacI family DNA-binding transcriptional regulator n=1 Tax=Enterococcus sp. BWR-S5 TaxID=2787714 RepID=UPI0019228B93|nr:LacI family DNA-binding transcriptional regulator [Enterococcus sp. BWR-S5]MBL1224113.1 LacI family DNA-binding transcriptional regulator [Enterococcus sp. BWR-S5]
MVTIKQVAEKSGYSQATVSRLLKGDTSLSIAEETRKTIIHTALAMGYDRSKIKTPIEQIAVLFWLTDQEELQDLYFRQLRISIEKYAKINNMEITMLKHEEGIEQLPKNSSGFIGIGSFTSDEIRQLKTSCPNGVFLEINPQPDLFDTVKPDTDHMTRKAIDYFIHKGYQKIGFIGGAFFDPDTGSEEMDSRESAFRDYLLKKGLLNEKYIFSGGHFTVDQGYQLTSALIASSDDDLPEAFFVASDTIAVGALQAFNEKGILIPDRLELLSINDNEIAKFVSPPLTTFKIDVEEIAKTAIDMLVDQLIYPRKTTKTVLLGSELIVRKSFIPAAKDETSK